MKRIFCVSIVCVSFQFITTGQSTYYVDDDIVTSGDGSSFMMAFKTLQEALDAVVSGDEIRIAGGTYYPTAFDGGGAAGSNRDYTFFIDQDIEIHGSIDPNTNLQDLENQRTILSGDIDMDGLDADNVYHVMVTLFLTSDAVFTGLQIEQGYTTGTNTNISFNGQGVRRDFGGAVINRGTPAQTTAPVFINCIFTNNYTLNQGAATMEQRSSATYINCLFIDNESANVSGMTQCLNCQVTFTNCSIVGNSAVNSAGGIGVFGGDSDLNIFNSVFWNNTAASSPDVQVISASSSNNAALPHANWGVTSNFKPLSGDPFRDLVDPDGTDNILGTSDDGLFPGCGSALTGKGSNAENSQSTDLTGSNRINGVNIDIGAYEFSSVANKFYVDAGAPLAGDGLSWGSAFNNLHDALCAADEGDMICIAGGIYYPEQYPPGCNNCSSSRDFAYYLNKDVVIQGGWDPESNTYDPDNQETILSGDIDMDGNLDEENVYHVFLTSHLTNNAEFESIHFTMGYADDETSNTLVNGALYEKSFGGGMNNLGFTSSPTLMSCRFSDNYASRLGGALLNNNSSTQALNCIFEDNVASQGGAVANINLNVPTFLDCIFVGNNATVQGGAMFNGFVSPDIERSVFTQNSATNSVEDVKAEGGAIFNFDSNPRIWNTVFDRNTADDHGGAMGHGPFDNIPPPFPRMRTCTFFGNTAAYGGALHFNTGDPRMFNSLFWGNSATSEGDDIYFVEGSFSSSQHNAGLDGEGIELTNNYIAITGNPFGNSDDPDGYDDIWKTNDDGLFPVISEVINAGDNATNNRTEDIVGNARVQFGTVDIGAYENRGVDIEVTFGGILIPDGDHSFSVEGTDFGIQPFGTAVTRNFVITNVGNSDIAIQQVLVESAGEDPSCFTASLPVAFDGILSSSESVTLDVTFVAKTYMVEDVAIITIVNDDPDESLYDFAVRAEVDAAIPTLTEWGLFIMGILLCIAFSAGLFQIRHIPSN